MQDDAIHDGEPGFEDFIDEEMTRLGQRAQQRGICMDCLTDRLVVEMVASLARAGISSADILSMVVDGLALAEEDEPVEREKRPRRVH